MIIPGFHGSTVYSLYFAAPNPSTSHENQGFSHVFSKEKELELLEKRRKDEAMSADLYVEMSKFVDSMEEVFLAKILEERRRDDGARKLRKGGTW